MFEVGDTSEADTIKMCRECGNEIVKHTSADVNSIGADGPSATCLESPNGDWIYCARGDVIRYQVHHEKLPEPNY